MTDIITRKCGVTAIIQHYYHERLQYLPQIHQALCQGSVVPDDIIIWNNSDNIVDVSHFSISDGPVCPKIISSNFNTLLGRYAAVLLAETDNIFIQDDDLLVGPDTLNRMLDRRCRTIVGISGRNLHLGDAPYTGGDAVYDGPADMVLGRMMCFNKSMLAPGINYLMRGGRPPGRADDIMFCLASPSRSYVVPNTGYINLDERGVGLSHEPQHMAERDELAAYYMSVFA